MNVLSKMCTVFQTNDFSESIQYKHNKNFENFRKNTFFSRKTEVVLYFILTISVVKLALQLLQISIFF